MAWRGSHPLPANGNGPPVRLKTAPKGPRTDRTEQRETRVQPRGPTDRFRAAPLILLSRGVYSRQSPGQHRPKARGATTHRPPSRRDACRPARLSVPRRPARSALQPSGCAARLSTPWRVLQLVGGGLHHLHSPRVCGPRAARGPRASPWRGCSSRPSRFSAVPTFCRLPAKVASRPYNSFASRWIATAFSAMASCCQPKAMVRRKRDQRRGRGDDPRGPPSRVPASGVRFDRCRQEDVAGDEHSPRNPGVFRQKVVIPLSRTAS